jgi:RNA recognition motif-containing protein
MVARSIPHVRPVVVRLRVSNLPFATTASQLSELFSAAGRVASVEVIHHAETGYPRGFAFVIMATVSASSDAIGRFDGFVHHGRTLKVAYERVVTGSRSLGEPGHQ